MHGTKHQPITGTPAGRGAPDMARAPRRKPAGGSAASAAPSGSAKGGRALHASPSVTDAGIVAWFQEAAEPPDASKRARLGVPGPAERTASPAPRRCPLRRGGPGGRGRMEPDSRQNPMPPRSRHPNLTGNPNAASRCGARTRQGGSCRQPAMPNGRCRLHGGKSTGPRTAEGLARLRAARTKHGAYSAEARKVRGLFRELKVLTKDLLERT